jgi:hypothetical protein
MDILAELGKIKEMDDITNMKLEIDKICKYLSCSNKCLLADIPFGNIDYLNIITEEGCDQLMEFEGITSAKNHEFYEDCQNPVILLQLEIRLLLRHKNINRMNHFIVNYKVTIF